MSKINSTRYCYGKTEMQSFANIFKGTEWIHLDFLVRKKKEESTLLNTFVPPYDDINEMFLFLKVFVFFSRRIINYCLSNCFTSFLFFFLAFLCKFVEFLAILFHFKSIWISNYAHIMYVLTTTCIFTPLRLNCTQLKLFFVC